MYGLHNIGQRKTPQFSEFVRVGACAVRGTKVRELGRSAYAFRSLFLGEQAPRALYLYYI